jgi:hypothetical protein
LINAVILPSPWIRRERQSAAHGDDTRQIRCPDGKFRFIAAVLFFFVAAATR